MTGNGEGTSNFQTIFDRVVVAEIGLPALPDDSATFEELGVDSLGRLNIVMALEDEIGVPWPLEDLIASRTLETIGTLRLAARKVVESESNR